MVTSRAPVLSALFGIVFAPSSTYCISCMEKVAKPYTSMLFIFCFVLFCFVLFCFFDWASLVCGRVNGVIGLCLESQGAIVIGILLQPMLIGTTE